MKVRLLAAALLLAPAAAHAGKLGNEFRVGFEEKFGEKRTYLVVVKKGVPTTSVFGVNGNLQNAYYSIDVREGGWTPSQGLLDTDQVEVDVLDVGEILELAQVSFKDKDNRVDLRTVSVETRPVKRGNVLYSQEKREPVSTNFKFFLPFPKSKELGREDVVAASRFIETYVKAFPSEKAARAFSAQLKGGGPAPATASAPRSAAPKAGEKQEIKTGMTPLQVIDILGKPQKETAFENKTRWAYPDLTVIFENGRVTEVKF